MTLQLYILSRKKTKKTEDFDDLAAEWDTNHVQRYSIFERDCVHSVNCQKLLGCRCTQKSVCDSNDKLREGQDKERRKNLWHNIRRRKGYNKELEDKIKREEQQNSADADPLFIRDLEEPI